MNTNVLLWDQQGNSIGFPLIMLVKLVALFPESTPESSFCTLLFCPFLVIFAPMADFVLFSD